MAIDPQITTTVKVGELASAPFNNTDLIPHEVAGILKKGTLLDLATYVGNIISTSSGVGFRDVQVTDGQTLPATTQKEFILVGAGTFPNVGGGATITTTEALNALVSNGTFWYLGVAIPINVEAAGVSQFIRDGVVDTAPSENVVYNALLSKVDLTTLTTLLLGKANIDHSTTHEIGGTDEIDGQSLKVEVIPSVIHYSPVNNSLKGHLNGIDTRLGELSTTTAGLLARVNFTGDVVNVNGTNFYASNVFNKGTVPSVIQTVSVNDDQTIFFAQDLISVPFTAVSFAARGTYSGQLTVMVNPNSAMQEFGIEVYRTNNLGVPIASGVTGATVGSLGVTTLALIDSGNVQLDANQITSLAIAGVLNSDVVFQVGERIRYHVYAKKVGTTGGALNMNVYYGSSYNSFYDAPVENTTDSVINKSTVLGIRDTDALDWLKANKQDVLVSGTNIKTVGGQSLLGAGNITEVQNSLTASSILAPSVDAVNIGLASKITLTNLSATTPLVYNNLTGVFTIQQANTSQSGFLSTTDWNTFNGKQNALTNPVTGTGTVNRVGKWTATGVQGNSQMLDDGTRITIGANVSNTGERLNIGGSLQLGHESGDGDFYLNGGDFRNAGVIGAIKFNVLNTAPNGTNMQFGRRAVTTGTFTPLMTLINSTGNLLVNTTTDNGVDKLQINGSAISTAWKVTGGLVAQYQTGTGTLVDFGTSARGTVLTGYVSGAGTVSATDTILSAIQKLNGNDALKANLDSPTFTGTPSLPIGTIGVTQTAGTNNTTLATTAFVTSAVVSQRPYKVYSVLLVQSGTSAPTVTVLENTLGGTVVWTRNTTGSYFATLTSAFISNKTFSQATLSSDSNTVYSGNHTFQINRQSTSIMELRHVRNDILSDDFAVAVEIRVYN